MGTPQSRRKAAIAVSKPPKTAAAVRGKAAATSALTSLLREFGQATSEPRRLRPLCKQIAVELRSHGKRGEAGAQAVLEAIQAVFKSERTLVQLLCALIKKDVKEMLVNGVVASDSVINAVVILMESLVCHGLQHSSLWKTAEAGSRTLPDLLSQNLLDCLVEVQTAFSLRDSGSDGATGMPERSLFPAFRLLTMTPLVEDTIGMLVQHTRKGMELEQTPEWLASAQCLAKDLAEAARDSISRECHLQVQLLERDIDKYMSAAFPQKGVECPAASSSSPARSSGLSPDRGALEAPSPSLDAAAAALVAPLPNTVVNAVSSELVGCLVEVLLAVAQAKHEVVMCRLVDFMEADVERFVEACQRVAPLDLDMSFQEEAERLGASTEMKAYRLKIFMTAQIFSKMLARAKVEELPASIVRSLVRSALHLADVRETVRYWLRPVFDVTLLDEVIFLTAEELWCLVRGSVESSRRPDTLWLSYAGCYAKEIEETLMSSGHLAKRAESHIEQMLDVQKVVASQLAMSWPPLEDEAREACEPGSSGSHGKPPRRYDALDALLNSAGLVPENEDEVYARSDAGDERSDACQDNASDLEDFIAPVGTGEQDYGFFSGGPKQGERNVDGLLLNGIRQDWWKHAEHLLEKFPLQDDPLKDIPAPSTSAPAAKRARVCTYETV
eukprot:TRINITY_DN21970_c0_g1_i2.p1 TRINITY_DN21970_c0_g1~~TRINITY_DN21970_c0_g1_i2.p1  ORF type:complete len:671 (-),score=175.89 TRINITY_DN21970_c0_g1_i2:244-2256(-)